MSSQHPAFFLGFVEGLQKEGGLASALANPRIHGALGGLGSVGGVGLMAGALGGAAHGAYKGYQEAKAQGESAGMGALGGAVSGAQRGAAIGGLAGGALGLAGGAVNPAGMGRVREMLNKAPVLGSGARFGQRQVHSLTNWRPVQGDTKSIRSIGMGAHGAEKNLEEALRGEASLHAAGPPRIGDFLEARKGVDKARHAYGEAFRAESQGLTSIPGMAQSVKDRGLLPTMASGVKEQWASMPTWAKGLALSPLVPAAMAAREPAGTVDPVTGRGKVERITRGLVGAGVNMATGGLSQTVGNFLVTPAVEGVAGRLARPVDKLLAARAHAQQPAAAIPQGGPQ